MTYTVKHDVKLLRIIVRMTITNEIHQERWSYHVVAN